MSSSHKKFILFSFASFVIGVLISFFILNSSFFVSILIGLSFLVIYEWLYFDDVCFRALSFLRRKKDND